MIKVSFNIVSYDNVVLNLTPMYYEFDCIRDFTNFIRENFIEIMGWQLASHERYYDTKIATLIVDGDYERSYLINISKIREFDIVSKMSLDEFKDFYATHIRNVKIDEILL